MACEFSAPNLSGVNEFDGKLMKLRIIIMMMIKAALSMSKIYLSQWVGR